MFSASGTFLNQAVLTGTVIIDTATGTALSGDLVVSGVATHFTDLQGQSTGPSPSPIFTELDFGNGQSTDNRLSLFFKPTSLVGYSGGPLCHFSQPNCLDQNTAGLFYVSLYGTLSGGAITDTSVLQSGALSSAAPEPSSLLAMAGALLSIAWRLRFRSSGQRPIQRI